MKIVFFELEQWEKEMIDPYFREHEVVYVDDILDAQHMPIHTDADVICVFVNSHIDAAVLAQFPQLKMIATRSTGYDHIDIAAANTAGVTVSYVPGYGDHTVAEFAFGLILALSRKLYQSIDQIKETGSFSLHGLRGFDLKDKTIGIVGTGRIGKCAIQIAKGFGMKPIAFDIFPDIAFAQKNEVAYVPFAEILTTSDIISIHCPLTEKTRHLIHTENVGTMKKGVILVNTARGPIIETEALVKGLREGIIAGVGLDVLEEEGDTKDEIHSLANDNNDVNKLKIILQNHVLMRMPNVIITPHNAFNTKEALARILETTAQNIKNFTEGKPCTCVPK
jgi:D-lactate dehydrogenase